MKKTEREIAELVEKNSSFLNVLQEREAAVKDAKAKAKDVSANVKVRRQKLNEISVTM